MGIKDEYEHHHSIKISSENIKDLVLLADQYIKTKNNPDKTIDLLDMICARVKVKNISYTEILKTQNLLAEIESKKEEAVLKQDFDLAIQYKDEEEKLVNKIEKMNGRKISHITKKDILETIERKTNIPILEDKKKVINK